MAVVVASTVGPSKVTTRSSSAERFFQWSMYLLLATGFLALIGTGKLDLPSLAAAIPALLVRGVLLLMHKQIVLSESWTTRLTIIYLPFFAADYFYFSQSIVIAAAHMVLFLVIMKIFSVRRDRDLIYLAVLSFLMVLVAAVLTVDTLFLLTFTLFVLAAMATFISIEIRRSERNAVAAPVAPRREREFHGSLAAVSAILGVLTLAGSALIFVLLPRVASGGYLRQFGLQSAVVSGFSQDVRLGGIGRIQQSSAVVMHLQVLSGKLSADPKWRGVSLANFDGHRWWNRGENYQFRLATNETLDLTEPSIAAFDSGVGRASRQPTLAYRVVMEPLGLNVFLLAPVPLRIYDKFGAFQIAADGSVFDARSNDAESWRGIGVYTAEADTRDPEPLVRDSNSRDYPPRVSRTYLQLPPLDRRIPELAREATATSRTNYARARALESYLKANFPYTLELPAAEQQDPLAYFLFERRRGHCEYFASAMAVMLRTLGIPSRIVNGFRGGEFNRLTERYIIRERDAHSWVEAYFPEYGWVSFDPTPAASGPLPGSEWSLALYLDAAREMWREWVVNYDFSHQVRLSNELTTASNNVQSNLRTWMRGKYGLLIARVADWQRRMERMPLWEMAIACAVLAVLLALPFLPKAWRGLRQARLRKDPQRAPKSAASFWYLRMLNRLARKGLRKAPSQTPAEFASSISDPRTREDVVLFTEHYERARFAASVEDAKRLPALYEVLAGKR